ncbi:TetR/AcrR family transcriptional regulator [Clostridium sp. KNHs216]|uniref:TetR/AcrR family transcriptional regulator n=1 Tax=Clostridium sp. KNHs216 TaxID=1550235 RepID=UPI001174B629|nr:TetR/AcrR family transcriptional regulator [Clostridium sp. KNHs216]TQI66115.1 TetR family transcriptional regulator [Clostridium sp. KNHs216]
MARPKKDPNIKRKEFIDQAAVLFFEKGYNDTSIQDILYAVGKDGALSPSVFYYYFKSKDEIFEAVVQDYMNQYIGQIMDVLEQEHLSYAEKMRKSVAIYRNAIEDFKKIDAYFDQDTPRVSYFNYLIDSQAISSLIDPLDQLLRQGVKSGCIPKTALLMQAGTKIMAQIFLSSIIPLTHQGRENDGQHHSEKYAQFVPQIFAQLFDVHSVLEEE